MVFVLAALILRQEQYRDARREEHNTQIGKTDKCVKQNFFSFIDMCGSRVFHNLHVYILIFQLKIFTEKIGYAKGGKIEFF